MNSIKTTTDRREFRA